MLNTYSYNSETELYWKMLKDVKSEVKLRLITLLSQSIINEVKDASRFDTKAPTKSFLAKHVGAWSGGETAEEIITHINDSHNCKEPLSFD